MMDGEGSGCGGGNRRKEVIVVVGFAEVSREGVVHGSNGCSV